MPCNITEILITTSGGDKANNTAFLMDCIAQCLPLDEWYFIDIETEKPFIQFDLQEVRTLVSATVVLRVDHPKYIESKNKMYYLFLLHN